MAKLFITTTIAFFSLIFQASAMDAPLYLIPVWENSGLNFLKAAGGFSESTDEISFDISNLCRYAELKDIKYIFIAKYGSLSPDDFFRAASETFLEKTSTREIKLILVTHPDDKNAGDIFENEINKIHDNKPGAKNKISCVINNIKDVILALYHESSINKNSSIVFVPCSGRLFDAVKHAKNNINALEFDPALTTSITQVFN